MERNMSSNLVSLTNIGVHPAVSAQTLPPKIRISPLEELAAPIGWTTVLARSALGYEIFNEAVDNGYIEARHLTDDELEKTLNLAKMKKVQMYDINRRQKKLKIMG